MVVVPAVMPVTCPEEAMEPTAGLLLLQTPPGEDSESVMIEPTHTLLGPEMVPESGMVLMVTTNVARSLPQLLVYV